MPRICVSRAALAGHAAIVGLLALGATAAPVGLGRDSDGWWRLQPSLAWADRGRGGGDSGSGSGSDDGGGSGRGGDDSSHGGSGSDDSGSHSGGGSGSGDSGSGGGSSSDGSGSGGGSGSGSSGSGGSGSDGSGSGSGSGGSSGGSDDSGGSGSGHGSDDSGGSHSGTSGSHSGSGSGSDDSSSSQRSDGQSGGSDRPRARVDLSERELESVLRGDQVLVDDRGRVLEVEIEIEHGVRTVTVKPHGGDAERNPGPIGNVRAVDASTRPARGVVVGPNGLEVEIEHGVAVTKPHGGAATPAPSGLETEVEHGVTTTKPHGGDPVQVGGDLTPAEEAALIQGGWR
ncbi:MAG: hypothetical protein U1E52_21055 [Geminicoccaceae bacterium]